MKKIIKKIIMKMIYGVRCSSDSYVKYLKNLGINIGQGCIFYDPIDTTIDIQNPHMISIGDNVRITKGVIILTHDYSWSVLSGVYGECLGSVGKVTIGNNVFIGVNSIITKGVTIGDNVIIGAGSVVTKDCLSNSIYAGNPAKYLMSIEDYYKKRKEQSLKEAIFIAKESKHLSKEEQMSRLREFSPLFCSLDNKQLKKLFIETGYYKNCVKYYEEHIRQFDSLESFIQFSDTFN